jgi:16S rRNA (cytosine1402-N4)-methyltransferase
LLGVDRDESALSAARERLAPFTDRTTLVHGSFGELPEIVERMVHTQLDGVLVDLGVSSPQLDRAERGFSFRREGPVDMRMDVSRGETARELCARLSIDDLADLIRAYGEERYAGRIARAIKEAIEQDRAHTTTELSAIIADVVPSRERHKDPATRTFQALRIAVNDELGEVERLLDAAPSLLRPGGRLVVISFHSLEDGLVKRRMREWSKEPNVPPELQEAMGQKPPTFRLLTRKPVEASEVEVAGNPRARSAKMRAAERLP